MCIVCVKEEISKKVELFITECEADDLALRLANCCGIAMLA